MSFYRKDYAYDFPDDLIATHPSSQRDACRLLLLDRQTQKISHHIFSDVSDFIHPGDVVVLNDTRVMPCRLEAFRATGGKVEIFLVHRPEFLAEPKCNANSEGDEWFAMIRSADRLKKDEILEIKNPQQLIRIQFIEAQKDLFLIKLFYNGHLLSILDKIADIPLPPYIRRKTEKVDKERYQTIFSREVGSVAAPTAGLHFTENILKKLQEKKVEIAKVTLHVGPGTFLPVRADDIREHQMHEEIFHLSEDSAQKIQRAKNNKKRIIAVGTTAARVLESSVEKNNSPDFCPKLKTGHGRTSLFIYPPYPFRVVDTLITNFHQPESTLLMLVSAFAGRELILKAYAEAIALRYQLFSYGDSMMIV